MRLSWSLVLSTAFLKSTKIFIDKEKHKHTTCVFQTLMTEGNEDPRVTGLCFSCGNFLPSAKKLSSPLALSLVGILHIFILGYCQGCPSTNGRQISVNSAGLGILAKWLVCYLLLAPCIVGESTSVHSALQKREQRAARAWPPSLHSHDTGLNILADTLVVVMVIIWSACRGMERRNAIKVEDKILSVTHWGRVMLVSRQSHWKKKGKALQK